MLYLMLYVPLMKLKNKNIAKFAQHIQFKDAWIKQFIKE